MDDLFEVVINGDEVEAMESDDDEFTVVAVAEEEMGDRLEAGTLEQAVLDGRRVCIPGIRNDNPSSPPVDFSNAREFSTKFLSSCHITSAI